MYIICVYIVLNERTAVPVMLYPLQTVYITLNREFQKILITE